MGDRTGKTTTEEWMQQKVKDRGTGQVEGRNKWYK